MSRGIKSTRISALSLGLIVAIVAVIAGGGAVAMHLFSPEAKRTASASKSSEGAEQPAGSGPSKQQVHTSASSGSSKRSREEAFWNKDIPDEEEEIPSDSWTPQLIAKLNPNGLVEAIKNERNPRARLRLVNELLQRDVASKALAEIDPSAIVELIKTERAQVSRHRLAEQLASRQMPPRVKEETATDLLLMPDGFLKLTAMEMLLDEPRGAAARLEQTLGQEKDPERIEALQGAIAYLKRSEQAEE